MSIDRWMDKEVVVYVYSGIVFSPKKWGNPPICNNRDGTWRHYTKWNKSDRKRPILYDLTYMWNLKQKKQKVQTSSYKISKYYGCNVQPGDYS